MGVSRYIKFDWMCKDVKVATFGIDRQTRTVSKEMFRYELLDDPFPTLKSNEITIDHLIMFFKGRIFPENRANAKEILKRLGLDYYSPQAIIHKTHGVCFEDYYWIRFEGVKLTYEDVKLRE